MVEFVASRSLFVGLHLPNQIMSVITATHGVVWPAGKLVHRSGELQHGYSLSGCMDWLCSGHCVHGMGHDSCCIVDDEGTEVEVLVNSGPPIKRSVG